MTQDPKKRTLYGRISSTPEERAEIIYNHPDNDRKEKIIKRQIIEYIPVVKSDPDTNMFQSNLGIMPVDYMEASKTTYSKNLKQERRNRVNEIRIQQRNTYTPIQKNQKERIDYINKYTEKKSAPFSINSDTANQSEITMKQKKNERKQKDYEQIAEMFYPEMKEESQIKNGNSQKYKLGNQEEYEKIGNVLFPGNTDDEEINRLKEEAKAELREIERKRWLTHAKNFGGAALEIGSAAIPLAAGPRIAVGMTKAITPMLGKKIAKEVSTGIIDGALSGGVYGLGEGLLNDENPVKTAINGMTTGALLGISGGVIGLGTGKLIKENLKAKIVKSAEKEDLLKKYYADYVEELENKGKALGEYRGLKFQNYNGSLKQNILYDKIGKNSRPKGIWLSKEEYSKVYSEVNTYLWQNNYVTDRYVHYSGSYKYYVKILDNTDKDFIFIRREMIEN